ncbi:MAG: RnfH family protein [Gammaproteobacteria bacterium]|nr:RnfH family protein [Gammaproteobacteria bacterium]
MRIEVAYALPNEQVIIELDAEPGITLNKAIEQSGVLERYPEIDLAVNKVGVFGKLGRLDDTLREGDRVEIYRKLLADPKQARRQRAEKDQNR